ncbi:MAG TPA: DUF642 domain-containing protein [Fimbriimonadaceae bacterium]|nr:DUF642 domain-containing protein [Fimbriimonadaceae bacterium]HRJ95958.1 DUF642 domain-containing protein [Fimbriimonadaceae bacterium]
MKNVALICAMAACGSASAELVRNGGFEEGTFVPNGHNVMTLGVGSTACSHWTGFQHEVAWMADPNPFGIVAASGIRSLDLTDYFDTPPFGGLRQAIATTPGAVYRLSLKIGTHSSWTNFATVDIAAAGASTSLTSMSGTSQRWELFTWDFTATSLSTSIEISGASSSYTYVGLDDVGVVAVGPTLSGHVDLLDYFGSPERIIQLEFVGGTSSFACPALLDTAGNFEVATNLPPGQYTVLIKASHWLRKAVVDVALTAAGPNWLSTALTNGDVDDDNEVTIGDYSRLSSAFGSELGSGNWDSEADLNGDEAVDIGDFAILSAHFGEAGD